MRVMHRTGSGGWSMGALLATVALTGCTWSRSFVDLELDREIKQRDYEPIAPAEHFITPGSIVVVDDGVAKLVCDWPSIYADIPAVEYEAGIPPTKYAAGGLELLARRQAVVRALEAYYAVESVSIGPMTETIISTETSSEAVTGRCEQNVRDSMRIEGRDDPPLLARGTISAEVSYKLVATSEKLSPVLQPVIPDIVRAFGHFTYSPQHDTLTGRLVLGVRLAALPETLIARIEQPPRKPRATKEASLSGLWIVTRWDEPSRPVTGSRVRIDAEVEGTLSIPVQKEDGTYEGVLSLTINNKESVVQRMKAEVSDETVKMSGNVLEGDWLDDELTLKFRGANELVGTSRSAGVDRTARVVLTKAAEQ